uniref:Uncharacterized protein n=1 Tax=Arundo donax TaxID=35708 RepID=A0A0A9CAF2_ARUDO
MYILYDVSKLHMLHDWSTVLGYAMSSRFYSNFAIN